MNQDEIGAYATSESFVFGGLKQKQDDSNKIKLLRSEFQEVKYC